MKATPSILPPEKSLAPVFIVGAPRSGTTMLAAMVGSHSYYAIGPETQFFSKLPPASFESAVTEPDWPSSATDLLCGLTLADQFVTELFGTTAGEIREFLEHREPSPAAMLEALTQPFAEKREKPGWAEKTPNHLLSLDQIRELWPAARIIRIMRDPRDSAISTCRLPTFSDSFAANIYMWRRWQDIAKSFFATDPLAYTMRYEDLVENPETELNALCGFLGIPYEGSMLDFAEAAGNVSSSAETWKTPVSGHLTRDRLFVWKKTLSDEYQKLANDVAYEYLEDFGYDHEPKSAVTKFVYRMSPEFTQQHEQFLLGLPDKGIRWLPAQCPEHADIVAEHPQYSRFHDIKNLVRLVWSQIALISHGLKPASKLAAKG